MRRLLGLALLLGLGCGDDTVAGPPDARADAPPDGRTDGPADAQPDAPADARPDASPDGLQTSDGGWSPSPYPDCPDCLHAQYVIAGLVVPQNSSSASALGCDIDADGQVDNRLGQVMGALRAVSASIDPQAVADQAFLDGRVILLHDLEYKPDFSATLVAGVRTFVGTHDPSDGLGAPAFYMGNGHFLASPPGHAFGGSIQGGAGVFGPGSTDLQLPLVAGQAPVALRLDAAQVAGLYAASSVSNGKLCGGIPIGQVISVLIPGLADLLSAEVKKGGSAADTLRTLFDADQSCSGDPACVPTSPNPCHCISASEIESNSVIRSVLTPDLDLDANLGNPWVTDPADPSYYNDALSVGVGFRASHAQFPLP